MTRTATEAAAPGAPVPRAEDLGIGLLFWHMRDAVVVGEATSGRVVLWNPAAEALFGYPAEEVAGMPLEALVPERLRPAHRAGFAAFAATGSGPLLEAGEPVEVPALRKGGEEIAVELSLTPIVQARVPGRYVAAVLRDATARRRTAELDARLAAIVESSDDAIIAKTLDGVITSWNPAAVRLYGYAAAEAVGQPIAMLVPEGEANDVPEILARVARGERVQRLETRRQAKDGRVLDIALTVSPIHDRNGQVVGASTIAHDITERKRLQAERDRLQAELEAEIGRAALVQAQLLPRQAPDTPRYDFAAACLPARRVGGDFFDWYDVPGGARLTLADVMGKGMAAALLMATARAALRSVALLPLAEAIATVNRVLMPDLAESDGFITLFDAQLDAATGDLAFVDAGHGLAFIRRRDGRVEPLRQRSLPLGVLPNATYAVGAARLDRGDVLVVYSDGLPDARPDIALDPRRVAAELDGMVDVESMRDRLVALAGTGDARPDDLTVMLVRRNEDDA